jgi:hypothetical protein
MEIPMSDGLDQAVADWRAPNQYGYLAALTRDAWAWEFLRRNPVYRAAWTDLRGRNPRIQDDADMAAAFGVLELTDPHLSALDAKLLWHGDASSFVLPLHMLEAHTAGPAQALDFAALRDRAVHCRRMSAFDHMLFLEEGRRLQLAIRGGRGARFQLLTETPLDLALVRRRSRLMHRLAALAASGRLLPSLYPPDPRGRRLGLVLRALDGWLAGASQQTIAQAVFAHYDVHADWRRPRGTALRHQIRRMIWRGRWLMDGGYRTLLR